MYTSQIMNSVNVSLYKTPATMLKKSVSPSDQRKYNNVFILYISSSTKYCAWLGAQYVVKLLASWILLTVVRFSPALYHNKAKHSKLLLCMISNLVPQINYY